MKVEIAKSAGFCFGVKRALEISKQAASCGKKVVMLGDIVHNEHVVKELENSGIKKIRALSQGSGKTLLIRAHGATKKTLFSAKKLGYRIIDATCPMVKEIHRIALNMENKGYRIIVIGDKNHDEVKGIVGQLASKAIVIENKLPLPKKQLKSVLKAAVVAQSTQNLNQVIKTFQALNKVIPQIKFFNTVCRPTRVKQEEVRTLPLKNELVIIIGSISSANTKRLYEISKSINPLTYWINSRKEIKNNWFKGIKTVGITAGASTMESVIFDIASGIRTF